MSSPMQAWNAWCALSLQTARLGWEAQSVIALRLMRTAAQSPGNQTEARRMVTEKVAALGEAQAAAATAVIRGRKSHLPPRRFWVFTRSASGQTRSG
jgi:hypothetical protein